MDKATLQRVRALGSRIRQARRRKRVSMEWLGETLGRSRDTVWNWEVGRMRISADDLGRMGRLP